MNPFSSLTITRRLLLVFITLVGGFLAVALAYQNLLRVEKDNDILVKNTDAFATLVAQIKDSVVDTHIKARDFLDTKDIKNAETFFDDRHFYGILTNLEQLKLTKNDDYTDNLLKLMRVAWLNYGNAFEDVIDARMLAGTSDDTGLQGEMRSSIRQVEQALKSFDQTPLMISLLQMRRYEKNFIARKSNSYLQQLHDERNVFMVLFDQANIPVMQRTTIINELNIYNQAFDNLAVAFYRLDARIEDAETALQEVNELINALSLKSDAMVTASDSFATQSVNQASLTMSLVMLPAGIAIALMLLFLSITLRKSLKRLQSTVEQVASGDFSARTRLTGKDELHKLGQAFDTLLSERMTNLAKIERENENLNESIIGIIETVARMSQKDLTVKATVAEDITGTIADALNLMAGETSEVLTRIRTIAQAVEQAAGAVNEQAETINDVAAQERRLVQKSAEGLLNAGQALTELAQGAQEANIKADAAMVRTRQALTAVNTSVQGIDRIRDIIRETEKRIKRLGERSQEITGAVNLINAISERTHILALNASMHAASAGEAGRGFAVVADEVQRLAESSQKATSDIAIMVNAIREETSDTLETMNRLIAQVADGTRQAQDAGQRMRETETTTADLVKAVQEMAESAGQQAQGALELRKQSQIIVRSTEQTNSELKEQSTYTVRLMEYANTLRESVSIFKLPT